jgi:uncharacterized protein (UPF0333 family)
MITYLRRAWCRLQREPERGGGRISLEFVLLAPIMVAAFVLLPLAAGRISNSGGAVEEAARAAAREASLQRDSPTAQSRATALATESQTAQGQACQSTQVTVDTSQFGRPLGQPAEVTATVTCDVRLSDLGLPGASSSKTMTATYSSVIDPYRERP